MTSGMDTVDSLYLQEPIHLLEHGLKAIQGTSQIVLVVGNPSGVEQQPLCRREVIELIAEVWLDLAASNLKCNTLPQVTCTDAKRNLVQTTSS